MVNFHETWASGKIWQKSFWLHQSQKNCARALASHADLIVTSNPANLRHLQSLQLGKDISLIPIGSNILVAAPMEKNWRNLLIFGRHGSRLRCVKTHKELLMNISSLGLIDKIVLAGETEGTGEDEAERLLRSYSLPVEIVCSYNFEGRELPAAVQTCGLSLMHTHSTFLLKSTGFQLAAHLGQVAITDLEEAPGDPVEEGKHLIGYRRGDFSPVESALENRSGLEAMADAAAELGSGPLSWKSIAHKWSGIILK